MTIDQLTKITTFEFDGEDETHDKYEQWSFQMRLFALDGFESILALSEGIGVFGKLDLYWTGKALRKVHGVY